MKRLETLREINLGLGHVADIEDLDAGLECPVHGQQLRLHRLHTVNGWQGLLVCPAFEGTCRYDPDGAPSPVDGPVGSAERCVGLHPDPAPPTF